MDMFIKKWSFLVIWGWFRKSAVKPQKHFN